MPAFVSTVASQSSELLLLNLLNCCFSIENWEFSIRLIQQNPAIWNGSPEERRQNQFDIRQAAFKYVFKFQLWFRIILKQSMLLEPRESVWTRKICLSFFQHWPLLALDREYWGGFGGSCWYQISHFCNWRGECYLCPPDPSCRFIFVQISTIKEGFLQCWIFKCTSNVELAARSNISPVNRPW